MDPRYIAPHYGVGAPMAEEIRACSSAGEHFVDIEGVTGSIPVTPTIIAQIKSVTRSSLEDRRRYLQRLPAKTTEKNGRLGRSFSLKLNRRPHGDNDMKIKNSLKALMTRHRENRMVRRKGRVYIINKKNPRFKARQG